MKFKPLEKVIKEVVNGVSAKKKYLSLEHSIRSVMEKKNHSIETDPNDQVVAGTYKTKNFEQSADAQKLYSNFPKTKKISDDSVEKSAIYHDKLFGIHKSVMSKKRSTDTDVNTATELVNKIKALAKDMDLEKEHSYVDRFITDINSHLDTAGNVVNAKDMDVEKIAQRFQSPPKDQTKEKQDSDIDNSRFRITRNLKAQRKIKIIDAD